MGYVRGEGREQGTLFPVRLDELVPAEHGVRVIEAFVDRLNLVELGFGKATPAVTGRPPYDPADLLKLYLYGYLNQVRSSRRLERECSRNVEVMWLLGRLIPDHKTIAEFRRNNGAGVRAACASLVQFCRHMGLLGGQWVAIDGSKFQAVASRRQALTREQLRREQKRLEGQIEHYLSELDRADAEDEPAQEQPEPLRRALDALGTCESIGALMDALGETQQVLGEPEAKLMRTSAGMQVAYNVQTAVDAQHALIVAHEVTSEATDNRSLAPMAQAAKRELGVDSLKVVADAGYSSGEQAAQCEAQGIEPYVPPNRSGNTQGGGLLFDRSRFLYDPTSDTFRCPARQVLKRKQMLRRERAVVYTTSACGGCALKAQCTNTGQRYVTRHLFEPALQRMQQRLQSVPEAMQLRRATVEHPFGTLKYQIFGHPRFLLRSRWGAGSEMAIGVLAYNLKRVINLLGVSVLRQTLQATSA
ncbi:MAG TPA: IS1182 family transposase [Casimicrobiaceae bacterium]